MAVQINVAANQAALTASIQAGVQAYNQRFAQNNQLNLTVNQRAFSQPLGRMTGDVKDFEAALAASNARVIAFGASTAVLGGVIRSFKELASVTIDVEKNLADINRVFGLSTSQLQKFSTELFSVGKQTASTFDDASKAALEFSRQGLKAEDVLSRTKDALTLARLAGIGTANAVDALTSTVNGFSATGITTTQILNKLVAVEQDYAVGAGDLAEALSRTGQAAQEAGVSLDQLNALVTTAQQSTARGGAVIGNALKTIFTRLQRTETLDQLEAFNIAVRDVQGNTLPAVQILQNFAGAYKTLGDAQRAQLSEQVAGVYQVNILKAIVGDLNKSQGVYAGALQRGAAATNEAEVATAKLNQTLDALLKQTATSTQQLANNIGKVTFEPLAKYGAEQLKSFVESMNEILEGEGVGSTFANGLLKGIRNVIAGPGAIAAFFTLFKLIQNSFTYLSQALPQIAGITTETQNRKNIEQSILQIMQQQGPASQALAGLMGNQAAQAQLLLQIARQQTAEYQMQSTLAKQLAAQLATQGVRVKGSGGLQVTRAGGYIPAATRMAEVVGAQAGGYAPGRVVSSPVGGVMNTAEDVKYIPGFAQPFINPPAGSKAGRAHRQNSISRTGVDPYMFNGFIPNFAIKKLDQFAIGRDFETSVGNDIGVAPAYNAAIDFNEVKRKPIDKGFNPRLYKSNSFADAHAGYGHTASQNISKIINHLGENYYGYLPKQGSSSRRIKLNDKSSLISNEGLLGDLFIRPYYTEIIGDGSDSSSVTQTSLISSLKTTAKNNLLNGLSDSEKKNILKRKITMQFAQDKVYGSGFIPNFAIPVDSARIPWFKKYASSYRNIASDKDVFRQIDFPTYGKGLDHNYAKVGNADMVSFLYEDFVRSAINIALGSKQAVRSKEAGFKNTPTNAISNRDPIDLAQKISGAKFRMLEVKQSKNNQKETISQISDAKLRGLFQENPELAKNVELMSIIFNDPRYVDPTGKNPAGVLSPFEQSIAPIVKNSYADVDSTMRGKLGLLTDGLLRRYEAKKNSFSKGFIPNFAYKQAVMGLEESMSGNKAIFDTKPFPHIRNSGQPTFSSAIADHGGLGNALSDSMRGQKAAGLMNKGFIPNFGPIRSFKRKAGKQNQNTQSDFDPSQVEAEVERYAKQVLADVKNIFKSTVDKLKSTFVGVESSVSSAGINEINSLRQQTFKQARNNQQINASDSKENNKFSEGLSKASTAIAILGPTIAGFAEQAAFGNKKRTEMTATERSLQSGLSTGLSAVSTGAGIGAAFGPVGLGLGAAAGALVGFVSALNAAKLSAEELAEMADNQKQNTQQNVSAGQKYIQAQQEYAKLLASGASSDKLELASKSLSESFNQITDVKLADELSKTKGGVEALNSVLSKFETDKNVLTAALSFSAGIKGGKTQGSVQLGERVKELKSIGLSKEQLSQLQSFKLEKEKVTRSISAGTGGATRIELEVVKDSSLKAAQQIAENIAQSAIGTKGTAEEVKAFQESILKLLFGEQKDELLKNLSSGNQLLNNILDNSAEEANLFKLRNKLDEDNLKYIAETNQQLKNNDFARKLQDEIFNFKNELTNGIVDPLNKIRQKFDYNSSKLSSEFNDTVTKLNSEFIEKNFSSIAGKINSESFLKNVFNPAFEQFKKGDSSAIEDMFNSDKLQFLDPKVAEEFKKAFDAYKRNLNFEKDNLAKSEMQLELQENIEQIKESNLNYQAQVMQKEVQLLSLRDRMEMRRKTTSQIEISKMEAQMSDAGNYLGRGVIDKSEEKIRYRNAITNKKLADSEASKAAEAQKSYSSIITLQKNNLITQGYGDQADSLIPMKIKDAETLKEAIKEINSLTFENRDQESKRIDVLENLKNIQEQITQGKITELEAVKLLNNQERIAADRAVSMKYGFKEGFDSLIDDADRIGYKLGRQIPTMFADGMTNALMDVAKGTKNIGDAFKDMAITFGQTLMQEVLRAAIGKALGSIGIGALFGQAGGNVSARGIGYQHGGVIRANNGQYVSGMGSGDRYPAMLENGEYVLNREAVKRLGGKKSLDTFNFEQAPRFASGGNVSMEAEMALNKDQEMDYTKNLLYNRSNIGAINENDYTAYAYSESDYFKKMREKAIANEQKRVQDAFAKKQKNAQLISSLVGTAGSLFLAAGMSGMAKQSAAAKKPPVPFSKFETATVAQRGGMIGFNSGGFVPHGSRLSDTIPALLTGGEYVMNNSAVRKYGLGAMNAMNAGAMSNSTNSNSTSTNNNTNNNATNISINIDRSGKATYGSDTNSYEKNDIAFSKQMAKRVADIAKGVISDESRYGGKIYQR